MPTLTRADFAHLRDTQHRPVFALQEMLPDRSRAIVTIENRPGLEPFQAEGELRHVGVDRIYFTADEPWVKGVRKGIYVVNHRFNNLHGTEVLGIQTI